MEPMGRAVGLYSLLGGRQSQGFGLQGLGLGFGAFRMSGLSLGFLGLGL